MIMKNRLIFITTLFLLFCWGMVGVLSAQVVISNTVAVDLQLVGFKGLDEYNIMQGPLLAGEKKELAGSYQGLALLKYGKGQTYPIILSSESFTIKISSLEKAPLFSDK